MADFDPYRVELDLAETLRQVLSRVRRELQKALTQRGLELSLPEAHILLLVHQQAQIGPQELSYQSGYDKAVIARKVKDLEANGLLVRQKDADDSRRFRLDLTARGRQRMAAVATARADVHQEVFRALSKTEQSELEALLRKCR